jgi:Fe2+ or Zn2+ uptake regulation protein
VKIDEQKIRWILLEHRLPATKARIQMLAVSGEENNHLSTEEIVRPLKERVMKIGTATIFPVPGLFSRASTESFGR